MKFYKRLTPPDELNPCYTYLPKDCMMFGKSVLSNCVGYVIGRIIEMIGEQGRFVPVNANIFYEYHKSFCDYGQIPKLGAIACWDNHIAIVEEIKINSNFIVSQSHYNGVRFDLEKIELSNNYEYRGHKFLGFIYLPIDFEENEKPQAHDTCDYSPYDDKYYRVRVSWEDARSQTGAFKFYNNAIAEATEKKLHCYDAEGRLVL